MSWSSRDSHAEISELTSNKRIEVGVRPARQIRDLSNERLPNASNDAGDDCNRAEGRMLPERGGGEGEVDVNRVGGE